VYHHGPSGKSSPQKPEGFWACERCRVNLALRRCGACQGAPRLCFTCFRHKHLLMNTVEASRNHYGEVLGCTFCKKCSKKVADRFCTDCSIDMCKLCFARVHRSPLLSFHTFIVI
jgi:hypothetical protein